MYILLWSAATPPFCEQVPESVQLGEPGEQHSAVVPEVPVFRPPERESSPLLQSVGPQPLPQPAVLAHLIHLRFGSRTFTLSGFFMCRNIDGLNAMPLCPIFVAGSWLGPSLY